MNHIPEVLHYLRTFEVHPLAGVIVAALLAALIEQRMVRRSTADFSAVFRDDGPPLEPPPKDMGILRSTKR
jgi:hypothetical protein